MKSNLTPALGELNEEKVLQSVLLLKEKGTAPLDIITQLQAGMEIVGRKFEEQELYLSELIYAAKIFKKSIDILGDIAKTEEAAHYGTIVIGTAHEDIHDIGKDLVVNLMSCNGFKVYDLGVDVPAAKFIEAINTYKPQFLGISCLLTTIFQNMHATIEEIDKAGLRQDGMKILIGGAPVDERVRKFVGADYYCESAQSAVDLCKRLVGGNNDGCS